MQLLYGEELLWECELDNDRYVVETDQYASFAFFFSFVIHKGYGDSEMQYGFNESRSRASI